MCVVFLFSRGNSGAYSCKNRIIFLGKSCGTMIKVHGTMGTTSIQSSAPVTNLNSLPLDALKTCFPEREKNEEAVWLQKLFNEVKHRKWRNRTNLWWNAKASVQTECNHWLVVYTVFASRYSSNHRCSDWKYKCLKSAARLWWCFSGILQTLAPGYH